MLDQEELGSLVSETEGQPLNQQQERSVQLRKKPNHQANSRRCAAVCVEFLTGRNGLMLIALAVTAAMIFTGIIEVKLNLQRLQGDRPDEKQQQSQQDIVVPVVQDNNDNDNDINPVPLPSPQDPAAAAGVAADPVEEQQSRTAPIPGGTQAASPVTTATTGDAPTTFVAAAPATNDGTTSLDGNSLLPSGYKRPPEEWSETYLPRGKPRTDAELQALANQWGQWSLAASRSDSVEIPYEQYPNRDVPRDQFPAGAWQTDPTYLAQFLPESMALVDRAMEAILAEYGQSKFDKPNVAWEERTLMFNLTVFDVSLKEKCDIKEAGKAKKGHAGCISTNGANNLMRSLLHAVMTEDQWTFVMGGHSSAAGHGNHFQQSYTLQVQRVLEPVFARLGVFHQSHNFGMGGLGTIQNALGAPSIYGKEIDLLQWDSSMTERDGGSKDIFTRQGLMGGNRVPVFLGDDTAFGYESTAKVGTGKIMYWGAGLAGIPITNSVEEMNALPWASKYLNCGKEIKNALCKPNEYNGTCWISRDDFTPFKSQSKEPGGRASWHPGNRQHQIHSRMIAFNVLKFLRDALQMWNEAENYALPDDAWHVTEAYKARRNSILAKTTTDCYSYFDMPKTICEVPMKSRTEFTPRNLPLETSIRSIMKPGGHIPEAEVNSYDPPDVFQPVLSVPDGEIDYLSIVENGTPFTPNKGRRAYIRRQIEAIERSKVDRSSYMPPLANPAQIQPGKGWVLDSVGGADNCDGTYNSFCNRGKNNECLLSGHNDHRGGLIFDAFSGWLVVNLEAMERGLIVIKSNGLDPNSNPLTEGWTCENNENCPSGTTGGRNLRAVDERNATLIDQRERELAKKKKSGPPPCQDHRFEFAIDGKITSWTPEEFNAAGKELQRVVKVRVLLDDPAYTNGVAKDVELAIRLTGACGRQTTHLLTHIYWA